MKTSGNRAIAVAVWRFMLFACIGLLMEVTLGAVVGLVHGDYNLRGSTCLWMILDYGLLGVLLARRSGTGSSGCECRSWRAAWCICC